MEKFKGEPFYNRKMARMVLKNIALGQAEGHASARMAAAFKEYQERHKNKEDTNGTADSV